MAVAGNEEHVLVLQQLSDEELTTKFLELMPILRDIRLGRISSPLHDEYIKGTCRAQNALRYKSNSICCLKLEQYKIITNILLTELCGRGRRAGLNYALDVLYPEGLKRLIMKMFGLSDLESIRVMYTCVRHKCYDSDSAIEEEDKEKECPFPLSGLLYCSRELLDATGQKCHMLGRGEYGEVYKGTLKGTTVAVKYLNEKGRSSFGGLSTRVEGAIRPDTVKAEMAALTKLCHPNIASIIGYSTLCDVIVYEYAQGGSLYKRLHEVPGSAQLQWNDRFHILRGTCCGLVYLHTAEHPIVHQDIKSQNILVDAHGNAKITDFGFALELPKVLDGRSMYTARAYVQSEGYYPGELTSGKYSPKSDVFSLGVVMLETYTGQKAFIPERSDPKLVDHLEDKLKSLASFKSCQDQRLGVCKEEWVEFLFNVVGKMLARHSKRLTSVQVMQAWQQRD